MQKKTRTAFIFVAIAILVVVALSTGFKYQVTGDTKPTIQGMVNLPNFASAKCQASSVGYVTIEGSTEYDMKNAAEFGEVAPQQIKEFGSTGINAKSYSFEYKVGSTIGMLRIYKVPLSYTYSDYKDLLKLTPLVENLAYMWATDGYKSVTTFNQNSEYYTPNEKIIVWASDVPLGGKLDTGDLTIRIQAQQYDLDSTTDRGLRNVALNTCDLSKIHTSGITRDVLAKDFLSGITSGDVKKTTDGKYVVPFDRAISYIASLSPVSETQDIIKRNGAWVWVMQPKQVCQIENSPPEFGSVKYYADCRASSPNNAPEIICMPSTPNCKPDGTGYLTSSDPKTCNFYGGGLPVGYYPDYISGDYNKYCKFTCEGGVVKTNSCVKLQNCAAGEKFDFEKGACVTLGGGNYITPPTDNTDWLLIAGAVLLGFMILASAIVLSKKKKR